jgi:3-carboxy-cis,cis-muconate cycloisomerase
VTTGLFGAIFARGDVDASDTAWLQAMLDTEAALARAAERAGLAPAGSGAAVTSISKAEFFENRTLGEDAAATGNPVPALVRELTRLSGAVVHQGATSQDIIDTAGMLIARRAIEVILADLSASAEICAAHATSDAVMSGRTLLQQAVPVTFGLVAAGWLTAIDEARQSLHAVKTTRLAIQFGGAAGTLASLGDAGPQVAAFLAEELDLALPVLPWHTNRLRIIEIAATMSGTCAALGKIARDITLLAQTEVAEVHAGTGGSSTMPHKQNPVAAITILGCTKQAPGLLSTLAAAAEQEHQRAAGAWHSEWQPFSHLITLTGSAANWSVQLLSDLEIDPPRMHANLNATHGLPLAESVTRLLTPALGALQAHDLVAQASKQATAENTNLADALLSDDATAAALADAGITGAQLESTLEPESYLGATAEFIKRALAFHAATETVLRA